jgi:hypothetical protein
MRTMFTMGGIASNCLSIWDGNMADLSDTTQNQSQTNTVIVQQIKVDRVGFEPTTSAYFRVSVPYHVPKWI